MSRSANAPEGHRFTVLLGTLFLLLLVGPVEIYINSITENDWLSPLVYLTFFAAVLFSAVLAIGAERRTRIIAIVLVVPSLGTLLTDYFIAPAWTEIFFSICVAVFIAFVSFTIIKHVFTVERVILDTVAASLCVYLLLAIVWSRLYTSLEILAPGSFDLPDGVEFGDDESVGALYYSLVTMTTLGYGDVRPRTPAAQMLSSMQAVVGQIYLVVLVARLVAMELADSQRRRGESGG